MYVTYGRLRKYSDFSSFNMLLEWFTYLKIKNYNLSFTKTLLILALLVATTALGMSLQALHLDLTSLSI